jgi:cysteine desulfurase/selenocysteine lyase
VLGTINPVRGICREARRRGIVHRGRRLAGIAAHGGRHPAIGCDFYAFTGHKMCGPTGTGALWARREHLAAMPPFLGGGEMIKEVHFDGTVFNDPPHRFEAGTPNIAGQIGLGAAVDLSRRARHGQRRRAESELLSHLTEEMRKVDGLRIIGNAPDKAAVVSFLVEARTPTTSPPCSTWRAWRSAPDTTARTR